MNKKILASSLLAFSIHSSADSLLDIYNDALENDPQYKSAEFSYLSGKELKSRACCTSSKYIDQRTDKLE
jgi:outer membrane protein